MCPGLFWELKETCEQFTILTRKPWGHVRILIYRTCPIAFRLKQGKQYIYSEDALDGESFIKFVEEGYKLAASKPVPPPISKL